MAAKFKVVDLDQPVEPKNTVINWNLCLLCQKNTNERLTDPENNPRANKFEGYTTLEMVINKMVDLGELSSLPFQISLSSLNDGSGMFETFKKNHAVYHKSCKNLCSHSRLQRAKKRVSQSQTAKISPKKTRKSTDPLNSLKCLFCNGPATRKHCLWKFRNPETSQKVIKYAGILRDSKLLPKIGGSTDLKSLKAAYHENCLAEFLNKIRNYEKQKDCTTSLTESHAYALATVIAYVNEVKTAQQEGDEVAVINVTDLGRMYSSVLKTMGVEHVVHTSRLRDRLLNECPYLMALDGTPGQEIKLTFRADVDTVIRSACRDYESTAFQFSDTAKKIRSDIFKFENKSWEECIKNQEDCTPLSLKTLVMMILRGPGSLASIDEETDSFEQVVNTISQLICYHATKNLSLSSPVRRHAKQREKPVVVYFAMKLFGATRKKKLIKVAHKLGLCISYDRLQDILSEKAASTCLRFRKLGVVCPPSMKKGVFTVVAADNLDHDTSSFTAKSSFHGTAITLTQIPTETSPGVPQETVYCNGRSSSLELPDTYSVVKPCFYNDKLRVQIPSSEKCALEYDSSAIENTEREWLEACVRGAMLPWPVYYSRFPDQKCSSTSHTVVLPLFPDQAHSMAMMIHCMKVASSVTEYVNYGQTPVLVVDQPLYAKCKTAQFASSITVTENDAFIMMGTLHIEMAALQALGTFLENSGLENALASAGVTSAGRAESMLKGSHVTRSRYFHQVTAAVLYDMQQAAYSAYLEDNDEPGTTSFDEWHSEKCKKVPQFKYWDLVLELECLVLSLVRATRTANFKMYKESLSRLVGWFFALDHVNYARWLPVHIRDLVQLPERHPDIAEKLEEGYFVARKSNRHFSAIAFDQNHEQANAMLKGDGGMIGLTENLDSLRKWVVSTPELCTFVQDFEEGANIGSVIEEVTAHHSDTQFFIQRFQRDCNSLKLVFEELGNPFLEDGLEIYNIETKVVAAENAKDVVQNIEKIGIEQYKNYVAERLESSKKSISDAIPQNRLSLWGNTREKSKSKGAASMKLLRSDCALFGNLFIACQNRDVDIDEFFSHENQPFPPALAFNNELRSCTKSDIIRCLTNALGSNEVPPDLACPDVDAKMIDGAALVHKLSPGPTTSTFQDYASLVFLPHLKFHCTGNVKRIDVVWDTYLESSIKNTLREKRGVGTRLLLGSSTKIPKKNWKNFLRDSENKTQLFKILAESIKTLPMDDVAVYSTCGESVISSNPDANMSALSPCNHEEADTRLLLHVADAARNGLSKVMIITVDSDVLTLAVAYAKRIAGLEELWVSMGTDKNRVIVPAHSVAASLGPQRSSALPIFHAFSGCDVVSSFAKKGKISAFEAWKACKEATEAFLSLGSDDVENGIRMIERYVVVLYDRTSETDSVNECRRNLFTCKGRDLESIPPTADALRLHCLRAAYQGGKVWGQCLRPMQQLPDPSEWGWYRDLLTWKPKWTTLPPVQKALAILTKCGCKKGCNPSRCKCKKIVDIPCTSFCGCKGDCE